MYRLIAPALAFLVIVAGVGVGVGLRDSPSAGKSRVNVKRAPSALEMQRRADKQQTEDVLDEVTYTLKAVYTGTADYDANPPKGPRQLARRLSEMFESERDLGAEVIDFEKEMTVRDRLYVLRRGRDGLWPVFYVTRQGAIWQWQIDDGHKRPADPDGPYFTEVPAHYRDARKLTRTVPASR